MADAKISALTAITTLTPATDVLPVVDVTGTTKKITTNQILGSSGIATLASATITGGLTVDTSTLKVDSANKRVGICTATPSVALDVVGASAISGTVSVGTTTPLATGSGRGNVTVNGSTDAILAFGIGGVNSGFVLQDSAGMTLLSSGATYLRCYTNGSERYKIDSTGVATWSNVGGVAGTAMTLNSTGLGVGGSPAAGVKLHVGGGNAHIRNAAGGQTKLIFGPSANSIEMGGIIYDDTDGSVTFGTIQNYATRFITNNTERGRFDASGNLLVGTTSQIRGGKLSVDSSAGVASGLKSSAGSSVFVEELWNTGSLDNSFINFGTDSTFTARGSITYNRSGGLVAYNTTSDYRAKDIIGPVSNSGSVIDSLKVYIGKMKGASVERPMLVAHEAQIVAPYSVTGQKDEVDADGNPKYQQMDVSSFVPLLIAEIQSLRTRVAALEA